jgi:hypothetical protein
MINETYMIYLCIIFIIISPVIWKLLLMIDKLVGVTDPMTFNEVLITLDKYSLHEVDGIHPKALLKRKKNESVFNKMLRFKNFCISK